MMFQKSEYIILSSNYPASQQTNHTHTHTLSHTHTHTHTMKQTRGRGGGSVPGRRGRSLLTQAISTSPEIIATRTLPQKGWVASLSDHNPSRGILTLSIGASRDENSLGRCGEEVLMTRVYNGPVALQLSGQPLLQPHRQDGHQAPPPPPPRHTTAQ